MAAPPAVLILALLGRMLLAGGSAGPGTFRSTCIDCHGVHEVARGTCTSCHRGDSSVVRVNLAHAHLLRGAAAAWSVSGSVGVRSGARLRDRLGCRRCHVSGGLGNALASSLDAVVWRRDQEELRRSIQHPVTTMPDFSLSIAQIDQLIAVLLHDAPRTGGDTRYLVRFRRGPRPGPTAFEIRCGPCHSALTPRGALGVGTSGPNLSGLLSAHYPDPDGRRWDRARLERWLRNPRSERPTATMPPIAVSRRELDEICALLGPVPAR